MRRLRARARASRLPPARHARLGVGAPARRDALPRDASARGDGRRHARAADRFHQKQPARRSRHAGANDAGTRGVPPGVPWRSRRRAVVPSETVRRCAGRLRPPREVRRARGVRDAGASPVERPRPRRAPGAKRPRAGVTPLRAFSRGNLRSDARGASLGASAHPASPPSRPLFIRPPDDPLTPPPPSRSPERLPAGGRRPRGVGVGRGEQRSRADGGVRRPRRGSAARSR